MQKHALVIGGSGMLQQASLEPASSWNTVSSIYIS